MATVKTSDHKKGYKNAIVNKDVKNLSENPFFVKKNEDAKATLSKVAWPEHMKK